MTTPIFGFPFPADGDIADGPEGFEEFAEAVRGIHDVGLSSYTPTWASNGSVQPSAPSQLVGKYRVAGGFCDVAIYMAFGPSTIGGRGDLTLTLPVAGDPAVGVRLGICRINTPSIPSTSFAGSAWNNGGTTLRPMFPASLTNASMLPWRSADSTGAVGTGIPLTAGALTVQNGGILSLSARYMVAL